VKWNVRPKACSCSAYAEGSTETFRYFGGHRLVAFAGQKGEECPPWALPPLLPPSGARPLLPGVPTRVRDAARDATKSGSPTLRRHRSIACSRVGDTAVGRRLTVAPARLDTARQVDGQRRAGSRDGSALCASGSSRRRARKYSEVLRVRQLAGTLEWLFERQRETRPRHLRPRRGTAVSRPRAGAELAGISCDADAGQVQYQLAGHHCESDGSTPFATQSGALAR